jgi:hypothetical protein
VIYNVIFWGGWILRFLPDLEFVGTIICLENFPLWQKRSRYDANPQYKIRHIWKMFTKETLIVLKLRKEFKIDNPVQAERSSGYTVQAPSEFFASLM